MQKTCDLIIVLTNLVKFLAPGFKVAYQLLSALAKLHVPQMARIDSSMQNGIECANPIVKTSASASKLLTGKVSDN